MRQDSRHFNPQGSPRGQPHGVLCGGDGGGVWWVMGAGSGGWSVVVHSEWAVGGRLWVLAGDWCQVVGGGVRAAGNGWWVVFGVVLVPWWVAGGGWVVVGGGTSQGGKHQQEDS